MDSDESRRRAGVLGFTTQRGGDATGGRVTGITGITGDTGEQERRLGVPLFPDRGVTRSFDDQRSTGRVPPAVRSTITWSRAATAPPVVVVVVMVVAVLVVAVLGIAAIAGVTPLPAALAVALLVPAAVVDIDEHRLPDAWVVAALTTFVAALAISAAAGQDVDARGALAGAAAMGAPVLALHLASPAAMGFGDVKVAVMLGAAIGSVDWRLALVGLCLAALFGAATGLSTRRRTIAFGPHLVLATVVMLIASDPILGFAFTAGPAR